MSLKLTKEEIARQFQLPERKSKLASIFKKEININCTCKSQDNSLFLVVCEVCNRTFHGHCIGMTEKEFQNNERYCCVMCQEEDPFLVSFNSLSKSRGTKKKSTSVKKTVDPEYVPTKKGGKVNRIKPSSCGICANCLRSSNCGNCQVCKSKKKSNSKEKCIRRICVHLVRRSNNSDGDVSHSDEDAVGPSVKPGMHCYGPGCVKTAQPNSKYCSDDCGMALATNRILNILPQRLQGWSISPSFAEMADKRDLEYVRKKQLEAQQALQKLDEESQKLEITIGKSQNLKPSVVLDVDHTKKSGKRINYIFQKEKEESSIYCVTCGQEIHTSSAIKHMEKCFIKYESQSSFGSMYKTRVQGNNIFCDFFSPSTKTYCKRLRVLCPEHTKEPPVRNDEVCGSPLTQDVFQETGELCLLPKKFCFKHYAWEKLRRAEIDMERVRQWLRMDELLHTEAQIRQRMSQRAGVLSLLLHNTFDHDAEEEMSAAQDEEQNAQLAKTFCKHYNKQYKNIKKEHSNSLKS